MRNFRLQTIAALLGLLCATIAYAQQSQPTTIATVPKLVRFSGSFHPANGMPAQPVESVTLSVYRDQIGGTPLWQETQNVAVDGEGKYSALMGWTQSDGVPLDLLSAGEPRWMGVQFNRPGEAEQPRALLTSVPYALKSVDAETLGGKPASAYLLASSGTNTSNNLASNAVSTTASGTAPATSTTVVTNTTPVKPRTISGQQGFVPVFTDGSNDLGDSVIQQSGGFIGVGTVPGAGAGTTPSLDLRTSPFSQIGMAQTTDYLTFFSSDTFGPAIYWNPGHDLRFGKGGTALYNAFGFTEQMRIQSATGNVGIGTPTPGSTLDVAGDVNFTGILRHKGGSLMQIPLDTTSIALGLGALLSSTPGSDNTALGSSALGGPTNVGADNTALGFGTLSRNTNGHGNTAVGSVALVQNTVGISNTAIGQEALNANVGGTGNTAVGLESLENNSAGNFNIALGFQAGFNLTTGNNNIVIGDVGNPGEASTTRIGNMGQLRFFAGGIRSITTGNNDAVPVMIDSAGQLGTVSSSRRYKEDIEDMGETSRDLMRLRPVTFRYKKPFADGSKPVQYGLIAEEVDEVYPDLVAHSADGQIETVKYQVLDSMLLNEVQKQYQHAQRQDETIRQQREQALQQQEQIRSLEARLAALEGLLSGKGPAATTAGR